MKDWVVVVFTLIEQRGRSRRFIGQILSVRDGKFIGKFLGPTYSRNHNGYVFKYPEIDDITSFAYCQIVRKLKGPQPYGAREDFLLFDVFAANL